MKRPDCYKPWCGVEGKFCVDCAGYFPPPPPEPTLIEMILQARRHGLDCISMVREPTGGRQAAILVLMVGDSPLRRVGPILEEALKEAVALGDDPDPDFRLTIYATQSIRLILEGMEAARRGWAWFTLKSDLAPELTGVVIIGTDACEALAPKLTEEGCPTSLR